MQGNIKTLIKNKLEKNISLAHFTTWRVGGPAEFLVEPEGIEEIEDIIEWANLNELKFYIIGAGSNLLINDKGLKGLCICMRKLNGNKIDSSSGIVEVLAGESLPTLSRKVAKEGLHGLEWAIGIPGTIGGACVMNAGAQGHCIADSLISIKTISTDQRKIFEIQAKDLDYSYRYSLLQNEPLIVLSAKIQLKPNNDPNKIIRLTNENLSHRIKNQPYNLPSCGSVFRNPEPLKAGQLIEELGLKGYRIGGAEVSRIHANFIVNSNNASADDIFALIKLIQQKVNKKHGFILHTEVKQLGFESKD